MEFTRPPSRHHQTKILMRQSYEEVSNEKKKKKTRRILAWQPSTKDHHQQHRSCGKRVSGAAMNVAIVSHNIIINSSSTADTIHNTNRLQSISLNRECVTVMVVCLPAWFVSAHTHTHTHHMRLLTIMIAT